MKSKSLKLIAMALLVSSITTIAPITAFADTDSLSVMEESQLDKQLDDYINIGGIDYSIKTVGNSLIVTGSNGDVSVLNNATGEIETTFNNQTQSYNVNDLVYDSSENIESIAPYAVTPSGYYFIASRYNSTYKITGYLYGQNRPVVYGATKVLNISPGTACSVLLSVLYSAFSGDANGILAALGFTATGVVIDGLYKTVSIKDYTVNYKVTDANGRLGLSTHKTHRYVLIDSQEKFLRQLSGFAGTNIDMLEAGIYNLS